MSQLILLAVIGVMLHLLVDPADPRKTRSSPSASGSGASCTFSPPEKPPPAIPEVVRVDEEEREIEAQST